ncbi:hypothetical protein [Dactylosporangium sp. NPDC051484]|uniref:hypothetical protein n=1 Tax=Dactylosporangium sp. NPDC051484 TaxID=3154942 RepID=UPI00344F5558
MKRVAFIVVVVALLGGGVYWMYERGQGRHIPSVPPGRCAEGRDLLPGRRQRGQGGAAVGRRPGRLRRCAHR